VHALHRTAEILLGDPIAKRLVDRVVHLVEAALFQRLARGRLPQGGVGRFVTA